MWLFTTVGFFSAVQKPGSEDLTIRARVREDLDRLRTKYLPELGPTKIRGGTDYPYRASVPHQAFARACGRIIKDVHYANFKNAVHAQQGEERANVYGKVWSVVTTLETLGMAAPYGIPKRKRATPAKDQDSASKATAKHVSCGGVVFNDNGRILLVKPRGGYGGYAWTFPKGRPERGETLEQAAIREVGQESGVEAAIIERIPGTFTGSTTESIYYIMRRVRETGVFDQETEAIEWATPSVARALIAKTPLRVGRDRDLKLLSAALALTRVK